MDWGWVGSVLKVAATVAIGFPLIVYLLQERLIFYPQAIPEARRVLIEKRYPAVREVTLQAADGTRLHAWHLRAAPGAPLVIYFGGNAEEVSWMVEEAAARTPAVSWLLVDYRGYGASGGSPSERALVADALQWYAYAAKEAQAIYLFGRSLGSGVAVQLAAERPAAGVILVAPFDSLVEVAKHHYPFLPVNWMLRHRFDSVARAPRIGAPLLCFAARHDQVIPAVHAKRLYDAWAGPKRWVDLDGGHNSTDGAASFWPSIRQFLEHGLKTS